MQYNPIFDSDSYKYSQYQQYPEGITGLYSHILARKSFGGEDKVKVMGMTPAVKRMQANPLTMPMIEHAKPIIEAHGEPFHYEGFKYIVNEYGGHWPILIKAAPEGSLVPVGMPIATIEATDPKAAWVVDFLETTLLRSLWYPTTVATNSYSIKKVILAALEETGTPETIDFKVQDFGARGVSSFESACIGGSAHLANFKGTDTICALPYISEYYGIKDTAGFSIPATQHSTTSAWGRFGETDCFLNMLTKFGKPGTLLACVSDTYDIYEACHIWGKLKNEVIASGAKVIVRPDSGSPTVVIPQCLGILDHYYGHTVNSKGYKVLNNVGMIWGDGINKNSISQILFVMKLAGWSADNIAFGMGGALLQGVTRDDFGFAMKGSSVQFNNGKWTDIYKDPVTDPGKKSLRGRVTTYKNRQGEFRAGVEDWEKSFLINTYFNGEILYAPTFDEVRANEGV